MIVNKDFHIAKANVNNVDVPLFIDKDTSNTGINLHQGSVKIESEGRYSNINEFTLTPYSFTKNKSSLTLHLPSQWKIFNISNIKNDCLTKRNKYINSVKSAIEEHSTLSKLRTRSGETLTTKHSQR